MPAPSPQISKALEKDLRGLGQRIRDHRRELGVSAVAAAEAAGMSRVTLYRIERGEPSVAIGAYLSVFAALGLSVQVVDRRSKSEKRKSASDDLPQKIRIADYKQLKRLAWQLKDTKELSPREVLELYERNWRHLDLKKMDSKERRLLESLLETFGRGRPLV